jgi:hypothetical protein
LIFLNFSVFFLLFNGKVLFSFILTLNSLIYLRFLSIICYHFYFIVSFVWLSRYFPIYFFSLPFFFSSPSFSHFNYFFYAIYLILVFILFSGLSIATLSNPSYFSNIFWSYSLFWIFRSSIFTVIFPVFFCYFFSYSKFSRFACLFSWVNWCFFFTSKFLSISLDFFLIFFVLFVRLHLLFFWLSFFFQFQFIVCFHFLFLLFIVLFSFMLYL